MSSKRLYFALLGLIGLLFAGLLAGVYGANGLLVSRADTLTSFKAKSQALTQQQAVLVRDKKDIQKYADLEKIAKVVVPEDKSQAEAVQEIVNIAGANGITIGSITFPESTLGNVSGSSTTGTSSGSSSSSAPSVPSSAGSVNASANKLSQLIAVKGIPGVYQLSITVTTDPKHPVLYSQLIGFLSGLENDRRTAQVNTISLQPAPAGLNYLNCVITLNEYIKP